MRNHRNCRRAFNRPLKWTTFFIKFKGKPGSLQKILSSDVFLSSREAHFAFVFPCEWSGPWNHMRTSKVFGKSERVDDFLQFRPLICLLFERSKKSHDLQEIIDFPELIKNLVHVSQEVLRTP